MKASPIETALDPASAAPRLTNLGFLSNSDLPDRPGPAFLLVALRDAPTLHHFDPELVEYWVSANGRGSRRQQTRHTAVPMDLEFSWGEIRIVDRLNVANEYLTFGGRLMAACIDGTVVSVFTSPAPLLRRGGHSQVWDRGADTVGAFFARVLLAVDYEPGFEALLARADPISRYAAFVADTTSRYRASAALRANEPDLWMSLQAEEARLRRENPTEWAAGALLRAKAADSILPGNDTLATTHERRLPSSVAHGRTRMAGAAVLAPSDTRRARDLRT
jgi:hypothetical protein